MLRASLQRWASRFEPCSDTQQCAARADLFFYFHTILKESDLLSLQESLGSARAHFGNVYTINAQLTSKQDVYGIGTITQYVGGWFYEETYPSHPTHLCRFYNMFLSKPFRLRYDFFFYMEPDVVVFRKHWLHELLTQVQGAAARFWIRGSVVRSPHFLSRGWGADLSVNGNALYRLGSPCFRALLQRSRNLAPSNGAFDIALGGIVRDTSRFPEQQRLLHRIQYSDFIRNYGDG